MDYVAVNPGHATKSVTMDEQPDATSLGRTVRMARLARGMSQADLADQIAAPRPYVSQIESGRIQWPGQYIGRIAVALGLKPSELGRAAGRIVFDGDYDPESGARVLESAAAPARAASHATATATVSRTGGPEPDPILDLIMLGARELTPAGRKILLAQIEEIREMRRKLLEDVQREQERDRQGSRAGDGGLPAD